MQTNPLPELVMIDIISATRMSEIDFWNESALGKSLRRLGRDSRLVPRVSFANQRGLPEIYNERITAADSNDILVFIHDDVWLDDFFLGDRIIDGLRTYDVIGVAGNRRIVPRQPSWLFMDKNLTWDDRANLTGAVAHGKTSFSPITFFGVVPADCELLDGVFLAARKSALTAAGAFFDPRFSFHFYDLDFCRTARRCGLRLGTWPICLTHQSGGAFGSAPWVEKYYAYIAKWEGQDCAETRPTGSG